MIAFRAAHVALVLLEEIQIVTVELGGGRKLTYGLTRYSGGRWSSRLLADRRSS